MISILYGGASKERCIAAAIFIVVEVVFLIALEFLGPALTTDPAAAGLITIIATAILTLWPWALDRISLLLSGAAMPQWIYFFSPLSAFSQILRGFTNASEFRDFFLACAIITTLSAAALLFSAWILSHTRREDDHPLLRFRAIRRIVQFAHHSQRQWARILRPRIEADPLLWYAAYDLRFVRYAWATVAITMVLWFAGFAAWGKAWLVEHLRPQAAADIADFLQEAFGNFSGFKIGDLFGSEDGVEVLVLARFGNAHAGAEDHLLKPRKERARNQRFECAHVNPLLTFAARFKERGKC